MESVEGIDTDTEGRIVISLVQCNINLHKIIWLKSVNDFQISFLF